MGTGGIGEMMARTVAMAVAYTGVLLIHYRDLSVRIAICAVGRVKWQWPRRDETARINVFADNPDGTSCRRCKRIVKRQRDITWRMIQAGKLPPQGGQRCGGAW